ncbi:Putative teichuronic acid biosynthesis glycosyltransferase TuaH [Sporomusa ovata DSM 2662]|uniref:Glycosyltransferase n=1 Tax=Sporomusa ovata TaxID=2378 RepID=A0A0U1KV36_9FIRM|nr:glycosyltransferase family 4 protein [Sporomusa ovata]EQB26470.1 glycosyltransferase, group 1 family protein [Sporomusa ovata DSM 2662]CQR70554.1 Glycosyltransferase [Sporomusa ovata]
MKIAYISNSIIPSRYANSVQVMKMCQAFADNGHEVTLLARFGWSLGKDVYAQYSVRPCFDILKYWRPKVFPKWMRFLIYTSLLRYRVEHMKNKPDLLYGRDVSGLLALIDLGIPTIYEAHGSPRGKSTQVSEGELFQKPNFLRLVVITDSLRKEYLDLYPFLSPKDIVVAHDGADIPDSSKDANDSEDNCKSNQVGYVGQLYTRKGMGIIAELISRMPDIEFHIIGGMPEDIQKWQEKLKKYNNVRFYGFIWQAELPQYYERFNIVLAPYTYTDYSKWTSPLKVFEYMALKKTIIASNIPVLQEFLVNRENALLVSPDNMEQWVECIRTASKDAALRKKLGNNAYHDLVNTYSWKARARNVIEGI